MTMILTEKLAMLTVARGKSYKYRRKKIYLRDEKMLLKTYVRTWQNIEKSRDKCWQYRSQKL